MDVLFVTSSLKKGGQERVISRLSRELSPELDLGLVLFSTQIMAYPFEGEVIELKPTSRRPFVFKKLWKDGVRLYKYIRAYYRYRPKLVVSFGETASFICCVGSLLTFHRDRLIVSVRNNPDKFHRRRQITLRFLYRIPARIVAVSEGIRRKLIDTYGLPAERCVHIPNGVNADEISELAKDDSALSDLPEKYILAVGRLVPAKGFDMLLLALSELHAQGRRSHLVIVGDGMMRSELLEQARALGLEAYLHFTGIQENPFPYMRRAQALVSSSRYEGWPNVIIESMAVGCPVVAFDCETGPGEIIEDGRSGLLVPAEDYKALAAAIARVTADEPLRKGLQEGAWKRVRQWPLSALAKKWLEVVPAREPALPLSFAARARRHLSALGFFIIIVLSSLFVKEAYPFSHFPMYSRVRKDADTMFVADKNGHPMATISEFGLPASWLKKNFVSNLIELRLPSGSNDASSRAAKQTLTQALEQRSRRRPGREELHSIALWRQRLITEHGTLRTERELLGMLDR